MKSLCTSHLLLRPSNISEAMAQAYLSGAYTMAEIGWYFGMHYMMVSRAVKKAEESGVMLAC